MSLVFQLTPAESREHNMPCLLFNFYDDHDVWHFLSSMALFFSFMVSIYVTCTSDNQRNSRLAMFNKYYDVLPETLKYVLLFSDFDDGTWPPSGVLLLWLFHVWSVCLSGFTDTWWWLDSHSTGSDPGVLSSVCATRMSIHLVGFPAAHWLRQRTMHSTS